MQHVDKLRTGKDIARDLRREFISLWGKRPIADIDRHDVLAVIVAAVERGAPHQARNLLAHVRKLFGWAISRGTYGLEHSPCSLLKPSDIVGKPPIRQRILIDEEWSAFWKATEQLGYPFGQLFRGLALTGCRRDELASARWSEIDFDKKLLTLSPERMAEWTEIDVLQMSKLFNSQFFNVHFTLAALAGAAAVTWPPLERECDIPHLNILAKRLWIDLWDRKGSKADVKGQRHSYEPTPECS